MAVTVTMPQLGETVTEGTILSWAKQPGETIEEDEVLLEISTDKVDTEVPSPAAGVIHEILVPEGETVEVGTPLAVIGEAGEVVAAPPAAEPTPIAEAPPSQEPAVAVVAEPAPVPDLPVIEIATSAVEPAGDAPRRGILSPVVRKLAAEHDVDLELVAGTGDGGRITRKDVETYIASGGAPATTKVTFESAAEPSAPVPVPAAATEVTQAPAPAQEPAPAPAEAPAPVASATGDTVIELGRLRKRIAENMVQAKRTAAHVWTSVEVDFEAVEQVRRRHKEAFKAQEGFSLTYLPFISRATMDALSAHPVVNSSFNLDEGQQIIHGSVNLGIAVDLNQDGLVVVSLRNADGLTLKGLAREIRAKATKARDGELDPDDISGSTFSITNPGPYGTFMSAPIINVPNVAILSTDTVVKRPTVITLPDGTDTIAIRHIGYLGLTWDHRAFDGSTAALFLKRIKTNLETWDWEQELA